MPNLVETTSKMSSSRFVQSCIAFLLVSFFASLTLPAQMPYPLEPGFQIDSVMVTHPNPNRLAWDPITAALYYCLPGGDVYRISMPNGQPATETLVATMTDHGIQHPQGLHFRDSVMYISGHTVGSPGFVTARITKGMLQPNGNRTWATVVQTQAHPASNHPFTSVISDPQGAYLYWASGARTMIGNVWSDNGIHPGYREGPYNTRIYKIPIGAVGLTLPDDSVALDSSGYVHCMGVRNAYAMAFDGAGELFAIDNSGERDDPEELNWIQQGRHYGFPWKMGDHWNPLMNPNYDVNADPLVNHLCGGYTQGLFAADPSFPTPPNVVFEDPIRNFGPDAVYFRDSITGTVHNTYDIGGWQRSFTAHRSPLGLLFDRDSLFGGQFAGAGYCLSFMPGGDSTGMSPLVPWGTPGPFVDPAQDLLKLDITWDIGLGEYVMQSRRIVAGIYLPVDAAQVGNDLYVLEQRGGGRSNLWRIGFPLDESAGDGLATVRYQMTVAPNPAGRHTVVNIQAPRADEVELQLRDLQGRLVMAAKDWHLQPGGNALSLDLGNLPAGMYLLQAKGVKGQGVSHLVVQ